MAQGQPDWGPVGPAQEDGLHLALVQSLHPAPSPGQPCGATVLVIVASPQGEGSEALGSGWQWAPRWRPDHRPEGGALGPGHGPALLPIDPA
eukprot:8505037-Alexandrium_andersonii.AAC.1